MRLPRALRLLLIVSTASVLAAALGMQFAEESPRNTRVPGTALRTIPATLAGWRSREIPLADTEEGKNAVRNILQFDEVVSRAYSRANVEFTLYVAYWRPGMVPPRSVGAHTPDTCWVLNGWQRVARASGIVRAGTEGLLLPAEFGVYALGPRRENVFFWHLVGGKPMTYTQEGTTDSWAPLRDLRFGLKQRQEQFFIRLSTTASWDDIWKDPGFRDLLLSLERLALGPHSYASHR